MALSKKGARAKVERWFLAVSKGDLLDRLDQLALSDKSTRSKVALKALELGLDHLLGEMAHAAPSSIQGEPEPAEPPPPPPEPKAPQGESSIADGPSPVCSDPFAEATSLVEFHTMLLGATPDAVQEMFYREYPQRRGSDDLLATVVMAMYATYDRSAGTFRDVVFAVTKVAEQQVIDAFNDVVRELKATRARLSNRRDGDRKIVAAVKHLQIGSRVFTIAEEPDHWVAFGFGANTPAPKWLTSRITQNEPVEPKRELTDEEREKAELMELVEIYGGEDAAQ